MQTICPKLSKLLKEQGIEQDSYFYHSEEYANYQTREEAVFLRTNEEMKYRHHFDCYSAFTLTELLKTLPKNITTQTKSCKYIVYKLVIFAENEYYKISYCRLFHKQQIILMEFINENPADAAGELLIWCIKKGHVNTQINAE